MSKKIVLILIITFFITGCINNKTEKVYLTDKYYNKGELITVNKTDIENLTNETYVVYTYNNFCNLPIHCETIFKKVMEKYHLDFLAIPYSEFKDTFIHETVSYAPSIIIVHNKDIIAYLDANKDSDMDKYQDAIEFENWINNYIYLNK